MLGYFSPHEPVLLNEVVSGLNLRPNLHVVDGTLGGGGHAQAMLEATAPNGKLLGLDHDDVAVAEATRRLQPFVDRVTIVRASFTDLIEVIHEHKFEYPIHAVLLDLGVSSHHFEDASRGFAFLKSGPLDMRMDRRIRRTAADVVNEAGAEELTSIFQTYGEEPRAKAIAAAIVAQRHRRPFQTTRDLVECIERIQRPIGRRHHAATQVFQALRIVVNNELEQLKRVLPQALKLLRPGGRLAVISFHSLEDRVVKTFFKTEAKACLCPPSVPLCQCGHRPQLIIRTKKPVQPTIAEVQKNSRSRSAKLRIAEKI